MMTLDEAIRHERHAMRQTAGERSEEHRQLAEWLCELRQARLEIDLLKAESAKLQGDIVMHALNNGLLVKCVTDRNDALKELVQDYDRVLSSMQALCDCDFVPLNDATLLALRSRMHDLGIEVDE